MKDSFKLIVVLTLTCVVCAFLVATAYKLTAAKIRAAAERQEAVAVLAVLPHDASSSAVGEKTIVVNGETHTYFETATGYALRATVRGYAGDIELTLGFTKGDEPKFWSYMVTSHSETPGLGSHITGSFLGHVEGRDAFGDWRLRNDGGEIVPITAATISSRAIVEAIRRSAEIVRAIHETEAK